MSAAGSIRKVEDKVSKLISAGQVITALKSAVKELVENSLDAGANEVHVMIHNWGGVGFSVTDDGCGIPPSALDILVHHRATSKHQPGEEGGETSAHVDNDNSDDGGDGSTLGFRGEALHCLGTLAAVHIETTHSTTAGPPSVSGTRPDFGVARTAGKLGTTVNISELFTRYPVRRQQFEATKKTQLAETTAELKRLAVTNPRVRVYCQHWVPGKAPEVLVATKGAGDLLKAVGDVYGGRLAADMTVLTERELKCGSVRGVISQIAAPRSTTETQIVAINERIVDHPKLKKGLVDSYKALLPVTDTRKTPAFVLFITLKGVTIDCNLTPDKRQVLLGDEDVIGQVLQAVEGEWKAQREAVPAACIGKASMGRMSGGGLGRGSDTLAITLIAAPTRQSGGSAGSGVATGVKRERSDEDTHNDEAIETVVITDEVPTDPHHVDSTPPSSAFTVTSIADFSASFEMDPGGGGGGGGGACCGCASSDPSSAGISRAEPIQDQKDEMLGSLLTKTALSHHTEVLGQFNNGFIMCKCEGRLFIVDQHAADEKYNFERLMRDIKLTPQPLVQPVLVPMEEAEASKALEHADDLKKHGFTIKDARPNGLLVTGLAPLQYDVVTPHDILELTQQLINYGSIVKRIKAVWHSCATKACRTSIMIGRTLDRPTMERVVKHLGELENPWSCPHGRPTLRLLGKVED